MSKQLNDLRRLLESEGIDCRNPYGDKISFTLSNGGSGNATFNLDSNEYDVTLYRQVSYNASSSVKFAVFPSNEGVEQDVKNFIQSYNTWCENTANGTTNFAPKSEEYQQFLGRKAIIETVQEGLTVDSYNLEKGTFNIRFPDNSGHIAVTPNEDGSFRASFYRSYEHVARSETTMRFENLTDLSTAAKEYSSFCENTVPYDKVMKTSPDMTEKLYGKYLELKDQLEDASYKIDKFQLRDNTFDINLGEKDSMRIAIPSNEEGYVVQTFQNGFRVGEVLKLSTDENVLNCVDQFSAHCKNPESSKEFNYKEDYSPSTSSMKSALDLAEIEDEKDKSGLENSKHSEVDFINSIDA